jgi:hypothetical protein
MNKIAGGWQLNCGHRQVISTYRVILASEGREQHSIFCLECNDWTTLAPSPVNETNDKEG